ncbi:MAG: Xaa-Pro peptidase family protein [Mangrovibacterium sp.]|nr:Xaa-Pro peptidase family protein [Mangrovibacterium sp.]
MNSNQSLAEDLVLRRERLQSAMQRQNTEACILTSSINIFYLTGVIYAGYLYVPATGKPVHFVKRPEGFSLANSVPVQKPELIPDALKNLRLPLPSTVFLETDVLSWNNCLRLLHALGLSEAGNASALLRSLRKVKTPYEIGMTRQNARQHEKVYEAVPSLYQKGMTDIGLQVELEYWIRQHGSLGIFRTFGENMDVHMGIVLSGDNAGNPSPFDYALGGEGISPALPVSANGSVIREGQTVMVDMAGNFTPWMTDITRVYALGKLPELAYRAHQVSLEIHQAFLETAKPGTACAALYELSVEITRKNKLESFFMGTRQQAKFVGHGVGLEINEPPVLMARSREALEPGIVFALEPKYVIPGVGAVGIENTYLVTSCGLEKLTIVKEDITAL